MTYMTGDGIILGCFHKGLVKPHKNSVKDSVPEGPHATIWSRWRRR